MITINDIAKICGVSKATVSRVLSNHENVSEKTRQKVLQVIKENNYEPNRSAQMLNKKASKLIGIIVPDITNPYFPQLVQEIEQAVAVKGYNIILSNTVGEKNNKNYIHMLQNLQVDGIIVIVPSPMTVYDENVRVPVLSLDGILHEDVPYIASNFYKGAYLAGEKLVNNGCKNILHLSGQSHYHANVLRENGFRDGIKAASNSENIIVGKFETNLSESKNYENVKNFFKSNNDIDGIFADNDSIGFTALRILNELKMNIPEDIQIIGYDDNFMIPMVYPLLSTIKQPIKEMGIIAGNTIINMINDVAVNKESILDVIYIKRDTTKT